MQRTGIDDIKSLYLAAVDEFKKQSDYDLRVRFDLFIYHACYFTNLTLTSSSMSFLVASTSVYQASQALFNKEYKRFPLPGVGYVASKYPKLLIEVFNLLKADPDYCKEIVSRDEQHLEKILQLVIRACSPESTSVCIQEIYAKLKSQYGKSYINMIVIPQALCAIAKGYLKFRQQKLPPEPLEKFLGWFNDKNSLLNKWQVYPELKNKKQVEMFLQEAVFATEAAVVDIVVADNAGVSEADYFFGAVNETKSFGKITVTIQKAPASKREECKSGSYTSFTLLVNDNQKREKKVRVHFFNVCADEAIPFSHDDDFCRFRGRLAKPKSEQSIVVQGENGLQLMLMAVFANNWRDRGAQKDNHSVVKNCLTFYCLFKQFYPAWQLTEKQFAYVVTVAYRIYLNEQQATLSQVLASLSDSYFTEQKEIAPKLFLGSPVARSRQQASKKFLSKNELDQQLRLRMGYP